MTECPTYTATVYAGRRVHYSPHVVPIEVVHQVLQKYVDSGGCGLTVTDTTFLYKQGSEPGVIVGLINDPRFPEHSQQIEAKALEIAGLLKDALHQHRVSVVFPGRTVMIGEP